MKVLAEKLGLAAPGEQQMALQLRRDSPEEHPDAVCSVYASRHAMHILKLGFVL